MPTIEKLLKQATKVTYRMLKYTQRGTHQFYYIVPRFSTDYIVLDVNVESPTKISMTMSWVPYEPGTKILDLDNTEEATGVVKFPTMAGVYATKVTRELARKMPHLEKIAKLRASHERRMALTT
jgi:hypothetical protein